ncbi:MAG TPA: HEAT repeat domain-containing protein [Candidatus Acidoferrales bacterium]|nr:HEAT repeat domain-containing protein [Candidatus Acidoferrales bacterium]
MERMRQEDNNEILNSEACEEFDSRLMLLAARELTPDEEADVADHLKHCVRCAEALEKEREMVECFEASRIEPDAALLASCRSSLEDALDRQEERGWWRRVANVFLPAGGLAPRPAWSAALLLLVGFSVGMLGPRFFQRTVPVSGDSDTAVSSDAAGSPNLTSQYPSSAPSGTTIDMHSAQVAGIRVMPSGGGQPPQVELQMKAQQPFRVQGTVNNPNVKSVLLNILKNNDRFDPDVRLDAVDLLRAKNDDPEVRDVLCHAVHTDPNAAVRLKALEALNGAEPQDLVRKTLLDALVDDRNPGVRVEAINALRNMAAQGKVASDDHMIAVLRDRMQKDPNTYIRLQSAAAIRDLGPREKF